MIATNWITLENAERCVKDAQEELRALYMPDGIGPEDGEKWEIACADTRVPEKYAILSQRITAALGHLANLREAEPMACPHCGNVQV